VLPHWEWELPDHRIDVTDLAKEFERLYEGVRRSKKEIEKLKMELNEAVGVQETSIFDAHIAILDDPVFLNEIQSIIQRQFKAAEAAVKEAIDHFVTMFDLLDDEYMKERAVDIKDVGNRLLKHLLGAPEMTVPDQSQPYILVVRELTPSLLIHLKPEQLLGIVTMIGSPSSHAAIMAKALNIPMVTGVEGKLEKPIVTGDLLVIDGGAGHLLIDPPEALVQEYQIRLQRQQEQLARLRSFVHLPAVTPDGVQLHLRANISSTMELQNSLDSGAEGVGLFRTEFLYMDSSRFPTEDEQFEVYKAAAERMQDKPLVIRTLDIGGDKVLDYLAMPDEENPFLGYRGIRFSLDRKDLFKMQLRAILRAAVYGNVRIMYPLITSVEEVREANAVLQEAKRELAKSGIEHKSDVPVGIMIEVPAAVAIADLLSREVSFFSIGTNDLIQFTLAVDRMNDKISHLYEPFHPAVIRQLRTVAEAARQRNIPVSVCGEMAGNPLALPIWLGLGIRELSMSPKAILRLKEALLHTEASGCLPVLEQILQSSTAAEIRKIAQDFYEATAARARQTHPHV
jgi:phosphotransferase system enzyme I (PtsI)